MNVDIFCIAISFIKIPVIFDYFNENVVKMSILIKKFKLKNLRHYYLSYISLLVWNMRVYSMFIFREKHELNFKILKMFP